MPLNIMPAHYKADMNQMSTGSIKPRALREDTNNVINTVNSNRVLISNPQNYSTYGANQFGSNS